MKSDPATDGTVGLSELRRIRVLHARKQQFILNLEDHHQTVVSILGPEYERLYVSYPT